MPAGPVLLRHDSCGVSAIGRWFASPTGGGCCAHIRPVVRISSLASYPSCGVTPRFVKRVLPAGQGFSGRRPLGPCPPGHCLVPGGASPFLVICAAVPRFLVPNEGGRLRVRQFDFKFRPSGSEGDICPCSCLSRCGLVAVIFECCQGSGRVFAFPLRSALDRVQN